MITTLVTPEELDNLIKAEAKATRLLGIARIERSQAMECAAIEQAQREDAVRQRDDLRAKLAAAEKAKMYWSDECVKWAADHMSDALGTTHKKMESLRARLDAANTRGAAMLMSLEEIALVEHHACVTGDCPHSQKGECEEELHVEIVRISNLAQSALGPDAGKRVADVVEAARKALEMPDLLSVKTLLAFMLAALDGEAGR